MNDSNLARLMGSLKTENPPNELEFDRYYIWKFNGFRELHVTVLLFFFKSVHRKKIVKLIAYLPAQFSNNMELLLRTLFN